MEARADEGHVRTLGAAAPAFSRTCRQAGSSERNNETEKRRNKMRNKRRGGNRGQGGRWTRWNSGCFAIPGSMQPSRKERKEEEEEEEEEEEQEREKNAMEVRKRKPRQERDMFELLGPLLHHYHQFHATKKEAQA